VSGDTLRSFVLQIHGHVGETTLTGTLYEAGDTPPEFSGAPTDGAPYVWVCDEFYAVETGGPTQQVGHRAVQAAFESPLPRGFESRDAAIDAAREHVRTQFARLGVPGADVRIEIADAEPER
jgi:hypothetical protein